MDMCISDLVTNSTNQGEHDRGWSDQTWWPLLCLVRSHRPYRSLSRCRIHPLDQALHQQQQLQPRYRPPGTWDSLSWSVTWSVTCSLICSIRSRFPITGLSFESSGNLTFLQGGWVKYAAVVELRLCLLWSHCTLFSASIGGSILPAGGGFTTSTPPNSILDFETG